MCIKKRQNNQCLHAVIIASAIASLAVASVVAAIAYMVHQKLLQHRSLDCGCGGNGNAFEPIMPDDDELDF